MATTAYIQATAAGRPAATTKYRASVLQRWVTWADEERTIDTLTTGLLADYADHLRRDGIKSVSRYVGLVEQWWKWCHNRSDTYPGVPTPRRITGADGDLPHLVAPIAVDTPTWDDVDAMLRALTPAGAPIGQRKGFGYRPRDLHRRVAVFQRFSGLRVSQILSTHWGDLDLGRLRLTIRAGRKGAKGQARDRIVPLHPGLAKIVASWQPTRGPVFTRVATKGTSRGQPVVPRGSEVAEVFTAAWERAGVSETKWGAAGERDKARPTNAIRARWKSTIAGVASYDLAAMMVGQSTRNEHDAYVAVGNPEASPYWHAMVEALGAVPGAAGAPTTTVAESTLPEKYRE